MQENSSESMKITKVRFAIVCYDFKICMYGKGRAGSVGIPSLEWV